MKYIFVALNLGVSVQPYCNVLLFCNLMMYHFLKNIIELFNNVMNDDKICPNSRGTVKSSEGVQCLHEF